MTNDGDLNVDHLITRLLEGLHFVLQNLRLRF